MTPCPRCSTALADDGSCPRCRASDQSVMAPLSALRPEAEPPLPAAHEIRGSRTPPLGSTSVRANAPGARKDPPPPAMPKMPESNSGPRAKIVSGTPLEAAPGPMVDPKAWFEESQGRAAEPAAEPAPLPDTPVARPRLRVPSEIGVLMTPAPEPRGDDSSAMRELSKERPTARAIKSRPSLLADADPLPDPEPITSPEPVDDAATASVPVFPEPEPLHDEPEASAHSDEPLAPPVRFPTAGVPKLVERSPWRSAAIALFLCIGIGAAVGWWLSNAGDDAKNPIIPTTKH